MAAPADSGTAPTHAPDRPRVRPATGRRTRLGVVAAVGAVVPIAAASGAAAAEVTVRPGDTLTAIAARSGTSVAALATANDLADPDRIRAGAVLQLPGTTPARTRTPATTPLAPALPVAHARLVSPVRPVSPVTTAVTVRAGDTLTAIAARTGTTVADLAAANHLTDPDQLRVGQVLTLRSPAAPGAPARAGSGSTRASAGSPARTPTVTPARTSVPTSFAGRTYPASTTAAAEAVKAVLAQRAVPDRAQVQLLVIATARQMGVDPALAQAVAFQESGFDARAVSPANAIGVMQVVPSSGQWASRMVGRPLDLLDPADDITAGVAILRALVASAPDTPTAIAGYYQGLAGVMTDGMYPDTRRYVANVQTLMTRFG